MRKKAPNTHNPAGKTRYGRTAKRTLTAQEHTLWQSATADATPRAGREPGEEADPQFDRPEKVAETKQPARAIRTPPLRPTIPLMRPAVPDLAPLDRRTSKKLVRGQLTPDASLDLHGMTRHSAEPALLRFVADARAQGLKLVLVITGKGAPGHMLHGRDFHADPAGRSVLRDLVPALLKEPQFRTHVTGFQPAHPKHGGGGAFYLWLRKNR